MSNRAPSDDAEHVMGRIDAGLDPAVDILAASNLPFVDVRGLTHRLQLLADPLRPLAIALGVADKVIGHAGIIGALKGKFKLRLRGWKRIGGNWDQGRASLETAASRHPQDEDFLNAIDNVLPH